MKTWQLGQVPGKSVREWEPRIDLVVLKYSALSVSEKHHFGAGAECNWPRPGGAACCQASASWTVRQQQFVPGWSQAIWNCRISRSQGKAGTYCQAANQSNVGVTHGSRGVLGTRLTKRPRITENRIFLGWGKVAAELQTTGQHWYFVLVKSVTCLSEWRMG